MTRPETAEALAALDDLTRQLRLACPWDREQDERSIVPHTLEEAYELADAANAGDDRKLLDELGDVLFQVHFLSLLLEERGAGDLGQVAEHCRQKLIRRHPHIFGAAEVESAADVLRNWDAIKADEPGREAGIFGEVPENLPALLLARKVQRRAASSGLDVADAHQALDGAHATLEQLQDTVGATAGTSPGAPADPGKRDQLFGQLGDLLFATTNIARKLQVDPELALRASAHRFRTRVEGAEAIASAQGTPWADASADAKLSFYAQAAYTQENP